tara:strand:+ start:50756 stop:52534 length:1779 start_codon:yes stop_codon:yes gene_type:complete
MSLRFQSANCVFLACVAMLAFAVGGCSGDSKQDAALVVKPPKPVSIMVLKRSAPSFQHHTTASVAPWKAERIGFEQPGRVVQVIEPNEMVKGPGDRATSMPLARLDDEQFRIAVDAARADAAVAQRRRESNLIAIEQRLPAQIKTEQAEQQLAESELARAKRLATSNSLSESEFETARTRASTALLRVASAKAELAQANAEQLALDAQVQQATQRLAEAERSLKNSVLFSSFPGQVTAIHAVPGTYVKEGDPIVTVQMVDPMLVEFEVTAANSRRYQRGDTLEVSVTDHNGQQRVLTGMVYTVDTIADANNRTFTVSLHVRNQRERRVGTLATNEVVARTKDIFPLNLGPIVTGDDRLLVEQSAIHHIGNDDFVWRITNRSWGKISHGEDRELIVERLKVNVTSEVIPFLGSWNFVAIEFANGSPDGSRKVDTEQDLITGRLFFNDDPSVDSTPLSSWKGNRVLLEQTRWMLRAGDTVRVAIMPESSATGFYVPMKAVRRENGNTFIHVVNDGQADGSAAKSSQVDTTVLRVMVNVSSENSVADESLMLRIEPSNAGELQEGAQVVVGGTHYVNDGDSVRIVPTQRASEGGR